MATRLSEGYSYILMKDIQGEKIPGGTGISLIKALLGGPKSVLVLRGELLTHIPSKERVPRSDGRSAHNYHSIKDSSVTLYGGDDDVAPVKGKELLLLKAIEKSYDRFSVFSANNKLEWGGSLREGDQVYVKIPSPNTSIPSVTWSLARVRYAGHVEPLPGWNFGVEIKDTRYVGRGSSDGFSGGYKYFECEKDCGLFVSLDKLAPEPPYQLPQNAGPSVSQHSNTSPSSATNQSGKPTNNSTVDCSFKIGDRVVVFNKKNAPIHGTVRWAGTDTQTRKLDSLHIGIETDRVIITKDYPKAVSGMTHLFSAQPACRLVVPVELVLREELANTRKPSARAIDLSDPVAVAREYGMTERQWVAEQKKALEEAEEIKKKEDKAKKAEEKRNKEAEPEEMKYALNESINPTVQKRALEDFNKEKKEQDIKRKTDMEQEKAKADTQSHQRGQGGGGGYQLQKQHSQQPRSTHPYEPLPGEGSPRPPHTERGGAAVSSHYHAKIHYQNPHGKQDTYYQRTYLDTRKDKNAKAELEQVKSALNESINLPAQKRALEDFNKEKKEQDIKRKTDMEQGKAKADTQSHQRGHGGGGQLQKQHSHQPRSEHPYERVPGEASPRPPHTERGGAAVSSRDHEWVHDQKRQQSHQGHGEQGAHYQGGYSGQFEDTHRRVAREANVQQPVQPSDTRPAAISQPPQQHGMRREGSQNRLASNAIDDPAYADYANFPSNYHPSPGHIYHNDPASQTPQYNRGQEYGQYPPQYHNQPENTHQRGYQHPDNTSSRPVNMQSQPARDQYNAHQPNQQQSEFSARVGSSNPYYLRVGSTIQVASTGPNEPPHYGVIKWIGPVTGVMGQVAGIELEEDLEGCTDGTFKATGERFFSCPNGRGLYFPLASLTPDERFGDVTPQTANAAPSQDNPVNVPMEEQEDQLIQNPSQQIKLYTGNVRGIQGHQNSSYLDSIIFGLFALNDIFDIMFIEPDQAITSDQNRKAVSELLWKGIVNPLRKNGVVRYESVMMMRNALDQLGKMEGITEKEKNPEEFLNMLLKHVLHTKPFISIRRPYGVEQEYFVQLFVEHDSSLKVPTVGELLKRMFKEQNISFTKIPSKLLIQVPRFGREFKTYQKTVPELKMNIMELTDSSMNAQSACSICGHMSAVKCEDCGKLSGQSHTHYCRRCSQLFHNNPAHQERTKHHVTDADDTDGSMAQLDELDLLSVICIETSHYVCFTRDPRDDAERKWIFFDSMADRKYDTYNIPRVTDCTRELNEWVYSGDRTRLMSTQPRQLPELVRRFTQDIYMCVYIQPDVAMYGGGDDEWGAEEHHSGSSDNQSQRQEQPTHDTTGEIDQLKRENSSLLARSEELQQKIEEFSREKYQLQQNLNSQQQESVQQLAEKEQLNLLLKHEKQQLKTEREQLQQQNQDLQQRLDSAPESSVSRFTKVQIPRQDQDSWNVRRREVEIQEELGRGAWGSVHRGVFRGRQVAVKYAHKKILYDIFIDQLKREIRIMAHVQHPNLVRLIAAVVDQSVERKTESPLLVLELLDTDLRSAYQTKVVEFRREVLLPIFRDVAYALHYLHEHQQPIIHRDVSAPNVLLQEIHPGVWRAKLSDFGSANLAKHCKTPGPGAIIYSAPETFPNIDPPPKQTTKIDVFSYGYLLAESVAKEMPSTEKRSAILSRIRREWAAMHDIITACTQREPERRLTMTQVLEKLHSL